MSSQNPEDYEVVGVVAPYKQEHAFLLLLKYKDGTKWGRWIRSVFDEIEAYAERLRPTEGNIVYWTNWDEANTRSRHYMDHPAVRAFLDND